MNHPLYDDEALVEQVTHDHMVSGRTVFQVWQLAEDEQAHSLRVLELLQLPMMARVLSLGCGVGGMEKHWHDARPDLTFELVNHSKAQLLACLCPGRRVRADANDYRTEDLPFDCTVLAYVLGHLDLDRAMATVNANTRPGGKVVVLDIFDADPRFQAALHYHPPTVRQMLDLGFSPVVRADPWHLTPVFQGLLDLDMTDMTPGMWVRDV